MAMFENFPYTDMHNLNLDWIIKIAKDFLDQYTELENMIETGKTDLNTIISDGQTSLDAKIADGIEAVNHQASICLDALQAWYNQHRDELSEQLQTSLTTLNNQLASNVATFTQTAENVGAAVIESIPADYSALAATVQEIYNHLYSLISIRNLFSKEQATPGNFYRADAANPTMSANSGYCCYLAEIYDDTKLYTVNYKDYDLAAYDANQNLLATVYFVAGTPHSVPAGTKYLTVSCTNAHKDEMMLVEGSLPSVYIPYGVTIYHADYIHDSQIVNGNLFDKHNVIRNAFYSGSNTNPTLSTNRNYCCYLAEIFDDEALYTVTNRDYQYDAFDDNKKLIATVNFVANVPHWVPKGTRYLSVSIRYEHLDSYMLVKGSLPSEYVEYGAKFKNSVSEEIYYVGPNTPNRYLIPLLKSLAGNEHPKTIYIMQGGYNIFEEYGGAAYIQTLTGNETWQDVSVFVPANTRLIGVGNVTLEFAPSDSDIVNEHNARLFSVLNLDKSCHIENLNLIAKNCRYCIHDEDVTHDRTIKHSFKNVYARKNQGAYGDAQAYGGGFSTDRRYEFENCVFSSYSIAWSIHSGDTDDTSVYRGVTINFEGCVFESDIASCAVSFRNNSNYQLKFPVHFDTCHFAGQYQMVELTDNEIANRPNGFKIICIGCNTFNPRYDLIEANLYPVVQY